MLADIHNDLVTITKDDDQGYPAQDSWLKLIPVHYIRVLAVCQAGREMMGNSKDFEHVTSNPNINFRLKCGSLPYLSLMELQHP